MKELIRLKNIYFKYDKQYVLKDVSLSIKENEVIGVLGHNGAGKTTIFRIMMRLLQPDNGNINLNDDDLKGYNFISYLPESNGIYENLSANENLMFRGKLVGMNKKDIMSSSIRLLKTFRLLDKSNERVKTFSNGMKKRLALAATLIWQSKVVILDEPTNGIDPESYRILVDVIKSLANEGKTLIISSHNLDFISRIATKVVIIQDGSIVYEKNVNELEGSLEEVYLKFTKKEGDSYDVY